MKKNKQTALLLSLAVIAGVYGYLLGSWETKPESINPITQPVTYKNQLGREITFDSIWNEGVIVRDFEGKKQRLIITIKK